MSDYTDRVIDALRANYEAAEKRKTLRFNIYVFGAVFVVLIAIAIWGK